MQTLAPSAAAPDRRPYEELGGFDVAPKGTTSMYDDFNRMANTDYATTNPESESVLVATNPGEVRQYLANLRDPISTGRYLKADTSARIAATEAVDQAYREKAAAQLAEFEASQLTQQEQGTQDQQRAA